MEKELEVKKRIRSSDVIAYGDGSICGKTGGYAYVILEGKRTTPDKYLRVFNEFNEQVKETTSNRMEIQAMLGALEFLILAHRKKELKFKNIYFFSDSKYTVNSTRWCYRWFAEEDMTKKNLDLWEKYVELKRELDYMDITTNIKWVKGHAGHIWNEHVDRLAKEASNKKIEKEIIN